MYLSGSYEFPIIKSLYAAILREIELGHRKWGDNFNYVETNILSRSSTKKTVPVSNNKKFPKNFRDDKPLEEKVWFCPLYQKNKCMHKTKSHLMVVKGKQRWAQHICGTCWIKDNSKLEHPECSSAFPNCHT